MPETRSSGPLVWIDCEMTGLDPDKDTIMSYACYITGPNLDLLEEGGCTAVIHHSQEQLDSMGEWCRTQHGKSGLSEACLHSETSPEEAAHYLLSYIKTYVREPRVGLLAGNTIHADRSFLRKPPYSIVTSYLHHRLLDVSAIKEAARRWAPEEVLKKTPLKKGLHDARADILESIEEARFYRSSFFQHL